MDSLPDEVLTRILLYLPTRDLLWSAPLVCRRWWQLVMCDCQRQVSLARHTPAASVTMALSARPGLRVLRCTGLLHAYTALPEALPLCPLLRCLEMGFATVPSAAVDAHKIAAALSPGLRHLNVEGIRNIEVGHVVDAVR